MWLMLQGRPKELVQNLTGDEDCLCLSIQGFPVRNARTAGRTQAQHRSEALTVPLTRWKDACEGSQACRMVCVAGLSRKDARAICSAGIRTRDTCGEAKHTEDYLNRKLCRYFKLDWTLGTCSKMFVRLLLPVPAYFAASEEREVCSCSYLGGVSWHRCWAGVFTPLHKHKAGTGTVTISSAQALVYTLLAAHFFTQYF